MKKFMQTPFGKRLPVALVMLAAAVGLGFLLNGFVGPESAMWQRGVFCIAAFGTGLAAFFFFLIGWPGLPGGYGLVLLIFLPKALPEPWNRYFSIVYLALLFLVPQVLKKVKKARTDESGEAEEAEEEEDETELPSSGDMLLVHFLISDRNYQLIRVPGELRAYRVGGEFRGFDEALLQDPKKPLRPLGKKDLSFPLDETFSVSFQERYNNKWDRDEVVVTLCSGRRKHRMNALGSDEQVRAFFTQCTANRAEQRSRLPKEPDVAPDPKRVALLRKVSTALLVATLLIDLPWLFLRVPYQLFAVLALLAPLCTFALYCIFPNDTTLAETKRAERTRAPLVLPLMLGSVLPVMRVLKDFVFLRWGEVFLAAGIALAVLLAATLVLTKEWRRQKAVLVGLIFPFLFYGVSFVGEVNYLLDTDGLEERIAVVEDMRISSGKTKSNYLTVVLPDGTSFDLSVDKKRYESTEIGDEVTVYVSDGALGIPYALDD